MRSSERSSRSAARSTQGRPSSRSVPKARPSVSSSTAASALRPRALHARAADGARAARSGARRAGAGRPLPLPRRRLPAAPDERSVSPYYHLNITDRRVPLTTVVETTHVVDPERAGGHLLYISKYVDPGSGPGAPQEELERSTSATRGRSSRTCAHDEIVSSVVQRARVTEPVHIARRGRSGSRGCSPCPGLALASTAHVYPEIVSGQAVTASPSRVCPGSSNGFRRSENCG